MTDAELKINAMKVLFEHLGEFDAERFIALMQRERFDYTVWQKDLWNNESIESISKKAMNHEKSI